MKQIAGVEIDGHLHRYPGVTYQTECGILLSFQNDSHTWDGMYPGMSWDQFYNDLAKLNIELITPDVAYRRTRYPLFVWPFKQVGICQKPNCGQTTASKYCSIHCWYFDMLETINYTIKNASTLYEVDANVMFKERLIAKFGPLVQFGSDADSAS